MPTIRIGSAASLMMMPWQHLFRSSNNKAVNKDEQNESTQTHVAGPLGIPSRSQQVNRLIHSSSIHNPYDILVIGGGATGAGIALDAASRSLETYPSLRVACSETGS